MSLVKYGLTIVVEMDTKDITGGTYDYQASIRNWVKQAEVLPSLNCEIIVSSGVDCHSIEQFSTSRTIIKNICTPGASYYALKNAAGNVALGEFVLFTDSDCRPCEEYLVSMLDAFKSTGADCLAGRSVYDGTDLLTCINTTASFGYLHQGDELTESCALAHNVAIRRSSFREDPFGPYKGRVGGDMYLTEKYRAGGSIPIVKGMTIYHENPTYSARGLLDRHLREIFDSLKRRRKNGVWPGAFLSFWYAVRLTLKRPKAHFKKIKKYGSALGIKVWHYPIVLTVLGMHQIVDMLAVMIMFITPGIRDKWIRYQFGPDYPY